jgi:glycosyltransferase involved in cell wall biosynthesis
MDWRSVCAAVIPCLNEEATISQVVSGVTGYLPTTIVIDDGSNDRTALLAKSAGARVISHARNLGKGSALQTGWRYAKEQSFPWVITLDGDGQHAPGDIPLFFECAEQTSAQLVAGNRMQDPAGMPPVRRVVNRWISRRLSRATRQYLPDSQCGFRLMQLDAMMALAVSSSHFEIESEVLLGFARAGCVIRFVPIQVIYKKEQSKIHPWRDTLRWVRWWAKVR